MLRFFLVEIKPLSPQEKFSVFIQTQFQSFPPANQSFMRDFDCFFVCRFVEARNQQPCFHKLLHHCASGFIQIVQPHALTGVRPLFAAGGDAHQAREGAHGSALLIPFETAEELLGALADSTFDSADFFVPVMGEQAVLALAPQFGQGEFKQGQIAGLAFDVIQDAFDQA